MLAWFTVSTPISSLIGGRVSAWLRRLNWRTRPGRLAVDVHQLIGITGITAALVRTIPACTIFSMMPRRILSGQPAAGGLALINSIGAFGAFVGPYLVGFPRDKTGSFEPDMIGMTVVQLIATVLWASIRIFMRDE